MELSQTRARHVDVGCGMWNGVAGVILNWAKRKTAHAGREEAIPPAGDDRAAVMGREREGRGRGYLV